MDVQGLLRRLATGVSVVSAKPYSAEELAKARQSIAHHTGDPNEARWLATVDALQAKLEQARKALQIIADQDIPMHEFDKKWGPYESTNHNYDNPGAIALDALKAVGLLAAEDEDKREATFPYPEEST